MGYQKDQPRMTTPGMNGLLPWHGKMAVISLSAIHVPGLLWLTVLARPTREAQAFHRAPSPSALDGASVGDQSGPTPNHSGMAPCQFRPSAPPLWGPITAHCLPAVMPNVIPGPTVPERSYTAGSSSQAKPWSIARRYPQPPNAPTSVQWLRHLPEEAGPWR